MADSPSGELLAYHEAAERLGLSQRDVGYLVYYDKIRHVLVDGVAHIPSGAVDEYLAMPNPHVPSETEPLMMSDAADRLGVTTLELVELWYYRKIRTVKFKGVTHVTPAAIEEYRSQQAS